MGAQLVLICLSVDLFPLFIESEENFHTILRFNRRTIGLSYDLLLKVTRITYFVVWFVVCDELLQID